MLQSPKEHQTLLEARPSLHLQGGQSPERSPQTPHPCSKGEQSSGMGPWGHLLTPRGHKGKTHRAAAGACRHLGCPNHRTAHLNVRHTWWLRVLCFPTSCAVSARLPSPASQVQTGRLHRYLPRSTHRFPSQGISRGRLSAWLWPQGPRPRAFPRRTARRGRSRVMELRLPIPSTRFHCKGLDRGFLWFRFLPRKGCAGL